MIKNVMAAGAVVLIAAGGAVLASGTAHAAPVTLTASTQVSNRPDGGHGGTWAYDDFTRTLTVTVAADQSSAPAGDTLYNATITDDGQFNAIVGALAPNQVVPGVKITASVHGHMHGTYSITVTAPTADTLTGTVPATEDDNFSAPLVTTTNWPVQAFASPTGVSVAGGAYNWTYTRACEQWTDSSANGDGNLLGDGNITGKSCTPPVDKVYDLDTRQGRHDTEVISWKQTFPSDDTVTVTGRHFWRQFTVRSGQDYLVLRLRDGRYQVTVTPDVRGGVSASTSFRIR